MAPFRDVERIMRRAIHKKQERTQTIQSEEPRIDDLKEGIPEFRNVRDRGVVQYVKYRDDIYSVVMQKEGLSDGIDEGAIDLIGNTGSSHTADGDITGVSRATHGSCSDSAYLTEWSCTDAGETWTDKEIGWETLSGGVIIQWGEGTFDIDGDYTVTFPKVFNSACFGVFVNHLLEDNAGTSAERGYPISVHEYSLTGFIMNRHDDASDTINFNYMALGH